MKLGMQVGLGPGHIVLDGDPAPLPLRGRAPNFGPYPLRPNGCMDQDATWYGGRPRPRRLCLRWGPRSSLPKRGRSAHPNFWPFCLLWPNGWMDQDATWYRGRPRPRQHYVRWGPSSPSPKGAQPPPIFGNVRCGQAVVWTKMQLGMEVGLGPGDFVLDGDPAFPRKKHSPAKFLAHVYCGQTVGWIKMPLGRQVGLDPSNIVLDGDPAPPP